MHALNASVKERAQQDRLTVRRASDILTKTTENKYTEIIFLQKNVFSIKRASIWRAVFVSTTISRQCMKAC